MSLTPFLLLLLLAAVVAAVATPCARSVAWRTGFVDRPNGRKDHREPTALLGGAAVHATLCGVPAALLLLAPFLPRDGFGLDGALLDELRVRAPAFLHLAGSATLVFAIGLWDDRRPLGAGAKLAAQLAAAVWVVAAGTRLELFGHDAWNAVGTVVWIALVGNAFNFFDNMDGLLAGVAGVSALLFLGLTWALEQYALAAMLAVYAGACLGFLPWNFPRARIFLGDAGSLPLGHVFAVLCVQATFVRVSGPPWVAWVVPPSLLALPLLDLAHVSLDRWRAGVPVHRGDHRHLSHRLARLGLSRVRAAAVVWLATFVMGSFAVLLPLCDAASAAVCLAGQGAFFLLLNALLAAARTPRGPGGNGGAAR